MERILIVDFGSQYTQLIARRVRELNVYCEIHPYNKMPELTPEIKGVIFSGSPYSVNDPEAPKPDIRSYIGKLPVLGVCYGAQLMASQFGAMVESADSREYGRAMLKVVDTKDPLFHDFPSPSEVWMSHGDTIITCPPELQIVACTDSVRMAAFRVGRERAWGIQFHPEVYHSVYGPQVLYNFVRKICDCEGTWSPDSFIESTVRELREKIGDEKVILGLSGGVDSSVAAMLLHRAIGDNLYCIFVNNGLLRYGEFEDVLASYRDMGLKVKGVDASERFYADLKGVTDPEQKRKIIGRDFIEVFNAEAKKFDDARWLAQGTIYPDVIESVSVAGPSQTIKSHHNVGGLPKEMNLKVVEPLRLLFKDEVRRVGKALGMKKELLQRHPFPGPGLGIRILGEFTPEKVHILQQADKIFIDGLRKHDLYDKVWQAGAILLPVQSVGVMGDERTYENCCALRAVVSTDGMTADWSRLPAEFLAEVSNEIINRVRGINRVVYDISSKPPATIEWE